MDLLLVFCVWSIVTIAIVTPLLLGLRLAYSLKTPRYLPASKPHFCLLPKYTTLIKLPSEDLQTADPVRNISEKLAIVGFELAKSTTDHIEFSKGTIFAELASVQGANMPLTLSFPLPLAENTSLAIEYATFAGVLFDTGDLWEITCELKNRLEADDGMEHDELQKESPLTQSIEIRNPLIKYISSTTAKLLILVFGLFGFLSLVGLYLDNLVNSVAKNIYLVSLIVILGMVALALYFWKKRLR